VDWTTGHAHASHPTHAAHAAHVEVAPRGHARRHGRSKQSLPLSPFRGSALEHVLSGKLVFWIHPHLVHVSQQSVLVGEDCGADGARPHAQTGGELAGHLWVAGQVLPQAALVHVELAAHGARVVGAASLCWHPGGIGVLVDKLHVFHQQLAGHAQLVADGTTAGVGTPHQGLVLYRGAVLASVGSQTAFRGKSLSTDVAVERPVFQSLDLRLVVSKVLLKVGQLDEGPTTLWDVALVRTLACV